jgi:hypothetical protein
MKNLLKAWLPLGFIRMGKRWLNYIRPADWEYVANGWPHTLHGQNQGWDVPCIAEVQKQKWPTYLESIKGSQPLGINHEANINAHTADICAHNIIMSYGYVLSLASWQKQKIKILDWGGGIGHYNILSNALVPDVTIDYYCKDLPLLCKVGRDLLPEAHFIDNEDECFSHKYDFVIASSSLWYEEEWRALVDKLIEVCNDYIYFTRMIFVEKVASYVAVQRPWAVGYQTEYLCWIFNRHEFIDYVCSRRMKLVREFMISDGPHIHRAPEQGMIKGFLFRK